MLSHRLPILQAVHYLLVPYTQDLSGEVGGEGHSGCSAIKFMDRTLTDNRNMFTSKQLQKGEQLHVKSSGVTHNQIHKQRKVAQRQARTRAAMC